MNERENISAGEELVGLTKSYFFSKKNGSSYRLHTYIESPNMWHSEPHIFIAHQSQWLLHIQLWNIQPNYQLHMFFPPSPQIYHDIMHGIPEDSFPKQ